MAKRPNQKLKLLYLSRIFLEKTDDTHKLTLAQIRSELERYGIYAERKTIYDDMEALRVFGIRVCSSRDKSIRYYVSQSSVELADVKIIYDLLASSGLFSETKTNELLKKFSQGNISAGQIDKISGGRNFTDNIGKEELYQNIQSVCEAILNDSKIKFKHFEWNAFKQREPINGGEVVYIAPISIALEGNRYFMYAFNSETGEIERVYLDRMMNVSVLNKKRELPDGVMSLIENERKENVRLRCDNDVAGFVFDRFGFNVTLLASREEYFEVALKTELDDEFYSWIFARKGKIRILSPDDAQKKYRELLEENLKRLI